MMLKMMMRMTRKSETINPLQYKGMGFCLFGSIRISLCAEFAFFLGGGGQTRCGSSCSVDRCVTLTGGPPGPVLVCDTPPPPQVLRDSGVGAMAPKFFCACFPFIKSSMF